MDAHLFSESLSSGMAGEESVRDTKKSSAPTSAGIGRGPWFLGKVRIEDLPDLGKLALVLNSTLRYGDDQRIGTQGAAGGRRGVRTASRGSAEGSRDAGGPASEGGGHRQRRGSGGAGSAASEPAGDTPCLLISAASEAARTLWVRP